MEREPLKPDDHSAEEPGKLKVALLAQPVAPPIERGSLKVKEPELNFDYSRLPEEHASYVKGVASSFKRRNSEIAKHASHLGTELESVKDRLDHGLFKAWINEELSINIRTAQRLMQVSMRLRGHYMHFDHLPVTALYEITLRSTSDGVLQELVAHARSGGRLSLNEIRAFLRSRKAGEVSTDDSATSAYCAAEDVVDLLRQALGEFKFRTFVTRVARTDKRHLLRLLEAEAKETAVVDLVAAE